jgi:hypothetical protein
LENLKVKEDPENNIEMDLTEKGVRVWTEIMWLRL